MDAMQKKRMWKVASAHFLLTVFVVWKSLYYTAWLGSSERFAWFEAWGGFWSKLFGLFQPQFFIFGFVQNILVQLPDWFGQLVFISSVPLWSICFGWIFVKLDNWLNHFPVLGKKVF